MLLGGSGSDGHYIITTSFFSVRLAIMQRARSGLLLGRNRHRKIYPDFLKWKHCEKNLDVSEIGGCILSEENGLGNVGVVS